MNAPQQVTSRYARNLLVKGRNNEFEITELRLDYSLCDGIEVGRHYQITIRMIGRGTYNAAGVTPEQSVNRCLLKHGVTFR